jgi:NAD+ kinase
MKIAVVTNTEKDNELFHTRVICSRLLELKAQVLVPAQIGTAISMPNINLITEDELFNSADIIITLGGDGTILHTAKKSALAGIPVLGINIGRLGFMAGIEADELGCLDRLLSGDYATDIRMMLQVSVGSRGEFGTFYALNDAVVSKGALSRIIDVAISCNGRPSGSYRADGVIVSTPTGSTAYSLSAGGPVIDPVLESIAVTPICPHSLISRTVLFAPNTIISLQPQKLADREAFLTIDGQDVVKLENYENVFISKAKQKAKLIRFKDKTFYEVLYNKFTERGV